MSNPHISDPVPQAARRSGSEMALRVVFGLFMAFVALALAMISDPLPFTLVLLLLMLFAAREWHRLVRRPELRTLIAAGQANLPPFHIQTIITTLAIGLGMAAMLLHVVWLGPAFLGLGAVAAFVWAQRMQDNPAWHAAGVFYLGLPALALVALRIFPTSAAGTWTIVGLFLIVWSTDTGALVFGKLIGGRKLWPAVSPGKTWAGTIGGTVTAMMIYALFAALLSLPPGPSLIFAAGISIVAHLGDLLESGLKRHFGTKDSGGLIPGHGGALDRMDSMLLASVVLAVLVFGLHVNPMFGGHA
jgi:phosphatidate cytidylyltransferase